MAPAIHVADTGLRQQILETERRATAAEEALRQIRAESRQRLEEARSALEREREARAAAERELELTLDSPPPAPEPPQALEPVPAAPVETEPQPTAVPEHGEAAGFHGADHEPAADPALGDEEEAPEWPTPWLAAKGRGRGLFRRSSS